MVSLQYCGRKYTFYYLPMIIASSLHYMIWNLESMILGCKLSMYNNRSYVFNDDFKNQK